MRKQLINLWVKKDSIQSLFHQEPDGYCSAMCIYDVPEFIEWKEAVLYELELISRDNSSTFIDDTMELLREQWSGWTDEDNFNQLVGKLKVIVNDYEHSISDSIDEKKNPKLFISHSTEDKEYVRKIVELFEDIGLDENMMFCSSFVGYDIPIDEDIYEFLKKQFNEYDVHVLFILSDAYYRSAASLNEMGATWILQKKYSSILLPGFEFREIRGVINPGKIALKLDNSLEEVKNKLGQLKDILIQEFGLNQMSAQKWERKRDQFINDLEENEKVIQLPEEEKEVLLVMEKDQFGQLLISESLEGAEIGNQYKTLVDCNPREEARWKAIISRLEEKGFIEAKNIERTLFVLLDKGYLMLEEMKH